MLRARALADLAKSRTTRPGRREIPSGGCEPAGETPVPAGRRCRRVSRDHPHAWIHCLFRKENWPITGSCRYGGRTCRRPRRRVGQRGASIIGTGKAPGSVLTTCGAAGSRGHWEGDPVTGQGRGLGGGDAHGTDDQVRQDRGPAPGQEVRWPGCQALGFAGARLSGRGDLG